jgi:hypothetical protein
MCSVSAVLVIMLCITIWTPQYNRHVRSLIVCLLVLLLACLLLISGSAEGWYIGTAASPASRPLYYGRCCCSYYTFTAALILFSSPCLHWVLAPPAALRCGKPHHR